MVFAGLSLEAWFLVGLVIAAGVLGMLYALSGTIRDFRRGVVLAEQIADLRQKQAERVAALKARAEAASLTPVSHAPAHQTAGHGSHAPHAKAA